MLTDDFSYTQETVVANYINRYAGSWRAQAWIVQVPADVSNCIP